MSKNDIREFLDFIFNQIYSINEEIGRDEIYFYNRQWKAKVMLKTRIWKLLSVKKVKKIKR